MRFQKSTVFIAFVMLTLSALGQTMPNPSSFVAQSEQNKTGVVVEKVEEGFAAARAGMQAGDVLLTWSCGGEGGAINTPFDLYQIEVEQSPRGAVTIQGRRGEQGRNWTLGLDEWKLQARPDFPPHLLALYDDARKPARADVQQEVESWNAVVLGARQYQTSWLSFWVPYQAAETLSEIKAWPQADSFYQQAVDRAIEAPPEVKAYLLDGWAYSFMRRNDWAEAEKRSREAINESQKTGRNRLLTATHLVLLGRVYEAKGDLSHGLEQYGQVLAIRQELAPGSAAEADALFRLGYATWLKGDLKAAEEHLGSALAIQRKLMPGTFALAQTLTRLSQLRGDGGDLAQAEIYAREAVEIQAKLAPEGPDVAVSLCMLGIVLTNRGNLIQADGAYRRALSIFEKTEPEGRPAGVAYSLIAQLEWARGELAASEKNFLRAEAILRKTAPETLHYVYCLLGLGILADINGDSAKAEHYLSQVVAIQEKNAPSHMLTADALGHLGVVFRKRGEFGQAEQYYLRALAIQKAKIPWSLRTAQTIDDLCDLADRRGDLVKAEEYCRTELAITERIAPGTTLHSESLVSLARILRKEQQLDAAARLYEESLKALEGQISRLGGSQETRAGFRAGYASEYFEYAEVLISQKRPDEAFRIMERSRARTLLEMLAAAGVDIRKGADPILLERERSLRAALQTKSDLRSRLMGDQHADDRVAAVNKEISSLASEYEDIEGRLRSNSPAYAALTQPQPLNAKQVQEQLLDSDTLLLEYALGEERSYVFAVSRDSLVAFELPKREEIASLARHVYELAKASNRTLIEGASAQAQNRQGRVDAEYIEIAAKLSRMVLGPVATLLKNKRILIVADGALQYVPFSALPDPATLQAEKGQTPKPLILDHEIVTLPSASVLAVLRQGQMDRKPAVRTVAVLADPVFDQHDLRISAAMRRREPAPVLRGTEDMPAMADGASRDLLTRSASDLGLSRNGKLQLPRLLFSRQEAVAIMAATPKGQGLQALDFRATRALAMSPELAQYRIVHFATHGLLNSEHPELSGLVFSLVDKNGKPQDGFLQLQDIYNLNLPADLVVLSACETGLGKEISGEGLIGLTRGFMYAGASRVVASLWKVSDVATAKLMANFYRAMEKDRLPPAAALRAAQIAMWKQKRWESPYYWAAFQIQGEYK